MGHTESAHHVDHGKYHRQETKHSGQRVELVAGRQDRADDGNA